MLREANTACDNDILVTFRLLGDTLDPETTTAHMALRPTTAHAKGEVVSHHPDRKYPTGYWGLDSAREPCCPLEVHIEHLLEVLESRRGVIEAVQRGGCSVSFYCAYFATTCVDNVLQLTPQTLGRIAALGARLELHVYCEADTEEARKS